MVPDEQRSFDRWISYVFDHPVPYPEWDSDPHPWIDHLAEAIACITRTFEECETVLRPFSDSQVAQGLEFLFGRGQSDYGYDLKNTEIPLSDRLRCIEAMESLFERCFAVRCSPLCIAGEARPEGLNPLEGVCYMWWDVLPLHGLVYHNPEHPDAAQLDRAILAVLKHILKIDSFACQESALYGLADCGLYYPETQQVIDDFRVHYPDLCEKISPPLRKYIFKEQ